MSFERLPDEIILEICRYLSSTDVLYTLLNLNSRLYRTIFIYRQHVVLRRTNFTQFEYLCLNVLPKIGSTIRFLSINANWTDLLAKRFLFYFGHRMKEVFPNVEHLILVAFSGNELNDYMESISDLPYLNKLTIQDRYNVTEEYKQTLFDKVLSANQNRVKKILFNRHSESLSINPINSIIYPNIVELNIHLEKINDLRCLFKLIPNVSHMHIAIDKHSKNETIQFDELKMNYLIEFHMESFRRSWIFDEISSLIKQMPFLKCLSLDIFSQDFRLFDGQQFHSILPINNLEHFNYAIDYTPEEEIELVDKIISSWESTPYRVCCLLDDSRTHMFLHTIPYGFSYLDISSLFIKSMNKANNGSSSNIKELLVFSVSKLVEVFNVINYCNKVKDLALEIDATCPTYYKDKQDAKSNISLTRLNKLHWLSIDGCPPDGHLIKEILFVAPNLSMLIIDMTFLLQLINEENDQSCISLLQTRIKHLSIQISNEIDLNDNNMEQLSNIFSKSRHIIIENKLSNSILFEKNILLFLQHFQNLPLVSIIFRGSTNEKMRISPSQWLIDHSNLKEYTDKFIAECDEQELKIWL